MKTKLFISPDNVMCTDEEAFLHPISSQISMRNGEPIIYLFENREFKNGVRQRKYLKTYHISKYILDRIVYRTAVPSLNTDDFGEKTFLREDTVEGLIDKYASASTHSPHISLFKNGDIILIKTNFPTVFCDNIYPMIVNSNFYDIVIKEFPLLEEHMKELRENERRFLGRRLSDW